MKRTFYFILLPILLLFLQGDAAAQAKQNAKISSVKQKGNMVYVTVTSAKEFYMGNNKHILYIGNQLFDLYDQENEEGKGTLRFHIPATAYKALPNGAPVYLSYGELYIEDGETAGDVCKQDLCPCWSLGKLNKRTQK
ncbi:hypothetical protein GCM10023093_22730 [Nemorincola caseinilytica]|uniref:Uncharacterized protein n=1 Tax=Nemorincola caseinilytica TaxID=2054315 RepID=A0ABP8NL39_9BACT